MSINIEKFREARKRFTEDYQDRFMVKIISIGNHMADAFGAAAPIDTGSTKDSWNASVGQADERFKDKYEGYYNPDGPPDGERIPEEKGIARWGQSIHISNNVSYIWDIHGGDYAQVQVRLTFFEFLAELRD